MNTYADTSFLVPLFLRESTSPQALELANGLTEPLPVGFLTSVEFVNALNARVYRREISVGIRDAALAKFEQYIRQGVWVRTDLEAETLRLHAERLSHRYTPEQGTRSLDLLHVGAAQILGCQRFLTFDLRQQAVAMAEGMAIV